MNNLIPCNHETEIKSKTKMEFVGFKTIKGYDNLYCVNYLGIVVSPSFVDKAGRFRDLKVLSPSLRGKGYQAVGLMKNGKQIRKSVHRLVAEAFIPNVENKDQVNHKDGNKTNNHFLNLEWVSNQENIQHSYDTGIRKGTSHIGERNTMAKLTDKDVLLIKNNNDSVVDLAKKLNVSKSTVYKIKSGIRWQHIQL